MRNEFDGLERALSVALGATLALAMWPGQALAAGHGVTGLEHSGRNGGPGFPSWSVTNCLEPNGEPLWAECPGAIHTRPLSSRDPSLQVKSTESS